MTTKLQAAKAKRAKRAGREGASSYAKANAADAVEAGRAGWWQRLVMRRATTGDLQDERRVKSDAMLAKVFGSKRKRQHKPTSAAPIRIHRPIG